MITVGDFYLDLREMLRTAGNDMPEFAANQILATRLGVTQTELLSRRPLYISDESRVECVAMARRAAQGEPLAYVLGQWDFFGLTLEITPDVLIPRPDTELLAQTAIDRAGKYGEPARILDLCCGSGCVGLAIAANAQNADVLLADNSTAALQVAKRNARRLGLDIRFMEADALSPPVKALGQFEVLVCNPPYVSDAEYDALDASVRMFEPEKALRGGRDGMDFYRAVINGWYKALVSGGALIFESGYNQARGVAALMEKSGYTGVKIYKDFGGRERVIAGVKL